MDEQFDDFKNLYKQKRDVANLTASDIKLNSEGQLKAIKRYQRRYVMMMTLTAGAIIYIHHVSSKVIATSVPAFWILFGCAICYGISRWIIYDSLRAIDPAMPTVRMIRKLEEYQKLNVFMQTWFQFFYIALLSLGVYLYLMPILSVLGRMNFNAKAILWLAGGGWMAWVFVHTFFIRKKRLAADNLTVNGYIESLRSEK